MPYPARVSVILIHSYYYVIVESLTIGFKFINNIIRNESKITLRYM